MKTMINNDSIIVVYNLLLDLLDVIVVLLPILLSVAFVTIVERKVLAAMQRRVGPNTTG
jgi:NADH-ubiquinone oxidoreductase chain 1